MSLIPFLSPVERRFDWEKSRVWLRGNSWISAFCLCSVYVVLVHLGKRWMRDKPAYYLRRPLTMWSAGLAIFSIIGFLTIFPALIEDVRERSFHHTVCDMRIHKTPGSEPLKLWSLLFLLSKTIELGDTMFVILRKTPLNFLHWYHHITVYIYSAWFFAEGPYLCGLALWFGIVNYFVHSVMYSYYTLKAAGVRILPGVSQAITLLQLAQFVFAAVTTIYAYIQKSSGIDCDTSYTFLHLGLAMYGSYFILFLNFFCQRYVFLKRVK